MIQTTEYSRQTLRDTVNILLEETDMPDNERHLMIGLSAVVAPIDYAKKMCGPYMGEKFAAHNTTYRPDERITDEQMEAMTACIGGKIMQMIRMHKGENMNPDELVAVLRAELEDHEASSGIEYFHKRQGNIDIYLRAAKLAQRKVLHGYLAEVEELGQILETKMDVFYRRRMSHIDIEPAGEELETKDPAAIVQTEDSPIQRPPKLTRQILRKEYLFIANSMTKVF
ncbi:MAG: hypothetical protein KKG59_06820 [Nanoarchaeota archaeon]|nr:hypothetical protein [Nanoarchaeota archaeon]